VVGVIAWQLDGGVGPAGFVPQLVDTQISAASSADEQSPVPHCCRVLLCSPLHQSAFQNIISKVIPRTAGTILYYF
jgi:hypothetical protein